MKNAELNEGFGQLEPSHQFDRSLSGSKENIALRPKGTTAEIDIVAAIEALAQCGLKPLLAKRAVYSVFREHKALLTLPNVISRKHLTSKLEDAGLYLRFIQKSPELKTRDASKEWIKKVRLSVGLTQKQFSIVFGIGLKNLQKYEQGDSMPTAAVLAYLQTIKANPEKMMRMRIEG